MGKSGETKRTDQSRRGRPQDRTRATLDAKRSAARSTRGGDATVRAARDAGRKVGDQARPSQIRRDNALRRQLRGAGIDVGLEVIGQVTDSLLVQIAGVAKTAIDMGVRIVGAVRATRAANLRAAKAEGLRDGLSMIWGDQRRPNNPHVRDGMPYDKDVLYAKVRRLFGRQIDFQMRTWQVEASDAPAALRGAVHSLVDQINPLLRRGRTAAERRGILRAFVDAAQHRLTQVQRQSRTTP